MFKLKSIYILPILSFLLLFIFPKGEVNAAKIEIGDYNLDKQSIVEDDLYISGDSIVINGVVDGDLVAVGQNITLDGTVTGDIYLFGTTVTVAGNIYGSGIVAGSSVVISGTLRDNVYIAAMMADLDGSFNKDIAALTGTFKLNGTVADDVRVASGQVISTASVGGDFLIGGDNYTVEENSISGDLIAGNDNAFSRKDNEDEELNFTRSDFLGFNIGLTIVNFLGMYIVGILLIYSAPVKTLQIEKKIISSWEELLKSYAIGLVILFTIPIPLFLLILTFVGAPLAFLIIGILIFLAVFGTVWTESAMGQKILQLSKKKDNGRFVSLLLGRSVSVVVRLIPIIRELYSLSLILVTVGAVVRTKYDAFSQSRKVTKKEVKNSKKK